MKKVKLFIEKNIPFVAHILSIVKSKTLNKYKIRNQQKNLKLVGKEALEALDEAFKELNIEWFLVYGTLLGAYREKDFISHDVDIDIGLSFDNAQKNIEHTLQKYGFKKSHIFCVDNGSFALEETYYYQGIGVDIFYFKTEGNQLIGYDFINEQGLSWDATTNKYGGLLVREVIFPHEGLEVLTFLDHTYLVPKNPAKHLAAHYGENFMQKDTQWNPYKAKNFRYIDNKKAKLTPNPSYE